VRERARSDVLAQHRHVEAADARQSCALGERRQQRAADAAMLPAVDHRDRHLSGLEVVLQPDVARDPDRGAWRRRERDQRLVVPVVDAQEPAQVPRAQHRLGREEAQEARALAQVLEGEHEGPAVRSLQLANREYRPVGGPCRRRLRRHVRSRT
jgi:hypothetical protein